MNAASASAVVAASSRERNVEDDVVDDRERECWLVHRYHVASAVDRHVRERASGLDSAGHLVVRMPRRRWSALEGNLPVID